MSPETHAVRPRTHAAGMRSAGIHGTRPFKVIEFNKDAKRIILSHSRIFEDAAKAEERAEKKAASNAKKTTKREEAPAIQNQAASTTLGDIDALAALKEQLENKKK